MYRMYYTDASTGEGSYFENEKGSLVYGPTAGLDRQDQTVDVAKIATPSNQIGSAQP